MEVAAAAPPARLPPVTVSMAARTRTPVALRIELLPRRLPRNEYLSAAGPLALRPGRRAHGQTPAGVRSSAGGVEELSLIPVRCILPHCPFLNGTCTVATVRSRAMNWR